MEFQKQVTNEHASMNVALSIIIPVFNAEDIIEWCLDRLYEQSFDNFEVILVNDGSTDGTANILSQIAGKYDRLAILENTNSGVSVSRNLGMQHARGKYLMFLDVDDCYAENGALTKIITQMQHSKADMLIFGFTISGDASRLTDTQTLMQLAADSGKTRADVISHDVISHIFNVNSPIFGYIWRTCFTTDAVRSHGLRFDPKLAIYEDEKFFIEAVDKIQNVVIFPRELYKYQLNDTSTTVGYSKELATSTLVLTKWLESESNVLLRSQYEHFAEFQFLLYLRYIQNLARAEFMRFGEKKQKLDSVRSQVSVSTLLMKVKIRSQPIFSKYQLGVTLCKFHLDWLYLVLVILLRKVREHLQLHR